MLAYLQTLQVDCRGYRQWQQVKRQVRQKSLAAYILRPHTIKAKNEETGEEEIHVIGFGCLPVFPYSSTEGEPLPELVPPSPPPLIQVAERFNLKVDYEAFNGMFRGSFDPDKEQVTLATFDERTFFHELSHAAHNRVLEGKLKKEQDPLQECVAELSACVLARIYGRKQADKGHSYRYIERYATEMKKNVSSAIISVLTDVQKVLETIIATEQGAPGNVVPPVEAVETLADA